MALLALASLLPRLRAGEVCCQAPSQRLLANVSRGLALVDKSQKATAMSQFLAQFSHACRGGGVIGGGGERTMGSLSADGMVRLLRRMPTACKFQPSSDVFLDIGSGLGQLPLFIRAATGVRAVGVEVDTCRHETALRRQKAVSDELPDGLTYVRGDARTSIGLQNATHVFMHSTCFGEVLLKRIVELADGVRCILDFGGRAEIRPQLAAWGVPVAAAPISESGVPLYYYLRRGLPGAEASMKAVDAKLIARFKEKSARATRGLRDACGHHDSRDYEDPAIG